MPAAARAIRRLFAGLACLLAVVPTGSAQQTVPAVRVSKEKADVRRRPDVKADVLETVVKSTTLEAIDREGDWYWVFLPRDENGTKATGWLYAPDVEVVSEGDSGAVLRQFTETIAAAKAHDASQAANAAKAAKKAKTAKAAKAAAEEEARLERAKQRLEQARRDYEAATQKTAKHDAGTK